MSDDKKCKDCRFYANGKCHKKPPKVVKSGIFHSGTEHKYAGAFPSVYEMSFCGKFKAKIEDEQNAKTTSRS